MRKLAGHTRLLVFLAVISMVAVLVASIVGAVQMRQAELDDARKISWRDSVAALVFGLEREYARYRGELAAATHDHGIPDPAQTRLRFEIFASRVTLLETTSSLDALRNLPEYATLRTRLNSLIEASAALLAQPNPSPAAVRSLLAQMDDTTPDVQSFTRAATVATARLVEQQFSILRQQAVMIGALALLQLMLVAAAGWVIWAQQRRETAARLQLEALADDLREATHAADAANRTKSQFLANMSHELRTPFQGVIGMLKLLEQTKPTTAQQDLIHTARESADHLLALLNDVLDVSAIEAGRLVLENSPVPLHRLCRDVQQLMRGQAFTRGLRLTMALAPDLPQWIDGDGTRIKQVLFNLLSNAIKFTPSGEITLTARLGADGLLIFTVTDTGIGMSADVLSRLFRRFGMGDETLSRRFGGAGLGLEISRSLARMMGGDLVAHSELGKGSTFTFTAALQACTAPVSVADDETAVAPSARSLNVLVADDHPINRKYLALVLSSMGHHCVLCENGLEAVEQARKGSFDVVLMDIHMPELDGLQASASIRAMEGARGAVPILVLTADVMPGTREKALAAGVTACLLKPLQPAQLAEALNTAVPDFADSQAAALVPVPPPAPRPPLAMPAAALTPLADPQPVTVAVTADQDAQPTVLSPQFESLGQSLPPAALQRLVTMFFKDDSHTLSALEEALQAGEPQPIELAAHKLKGSARLLGFDQIAAVADDIQRQEGVGAGDPARAPAMDRLRAALHTTRAAIEKLGIQTPPLLVAATLAVS